MNLAIIPARSGSKRLKNKNIKKINNLHLIEYTILAAIKSKIYDLIIVSSDDLKIKKICKKYKVKFFEREKIFSGDKIKVIDYLVYFLNKNKEYQSKFKTISLLLPTCPLRDHKDIIDGFKLLKKDTSCVVSISTYNFPYTMSLKMNNSNKIKPFFINSPLITGNTRSQNHNPVYHPNGGFYIAWMKDFIKNKNFFKGKVVKGYLLDKFKSYDIDDVIDLEIIKALQKKFN